MNNKTISHFCCIFPVLLSFIFKTQKPFKPPVDTTCGSARLIINGKQVGEGEIANVLPKRFSTTETLDIRMDLGATVSRDYEKKAPFSFNGTIKQVTVEIK
jgi:arylsulfatase